MQMMPKLDFLLKKGLALKKQLNTAELNRSLHKFLVSTRGVHSNVSAAQKFTTQLN